ncbi:MAG: leucine-rich repeat protein [Spirochaetaceae bacterium]|nr:leucine-rich repeat protein [Spirochaetaceae bacterium]
MKNKFFSSIYIVFLAAFLMLAVSCGGGGGGGGVSLYNGSQFHNGGGAGGWGKGNQTGTGFGDSGFSSSSSSDGLLFETIPSFFYPINHIDISLVINGTPAEFPGLDTSAKKDILGLSNGDEVSGTLVITLEDGSTRNATLSPTTIGIDTKLSFAVTYNYILIDGAGTQGDVNGTYTSSSGIDVSGITWTIGGGGGGAMAPTSIGDWQSDSGAVFPAGGIISGLTGDVTLTARYSLSVIPQGDSTIYRYGNNSLANSTSFTISGGSGTCWADVSSQAVLTSVTGTNLEVSVNSTYGSTIGQTVSGTATATGAEITVTVHDDAGAAKEVKVHLVDCVSNNNGLRLNSANSTTASVTSINSIPTNGVVNGIQLDDYIANDAFTGNTTLTSLTLPNNITTINAGTFRTSNPTTSTGAFSGSSIQTLNAPGLTIIGEAAFANSQITTINLSNVTSIRTGAFANCTNLASADLSHITSGGFNQYAFYGCSNLTSVTWSSAGSTYVPANIPAHAFELSGVTNSVIANLPVSPTGYVYEIGNSAFSQCSGLTNIIIPDGISQIDDYAFLRCDNLAEITLPNNSCTIDTYCFANCSSLNKITAKYSSFEPSDTLGANFSTTNFEQNTSLHGLDLRACSTVRLPSKIFASTVGMIRIELSTNLTSLNLSDSPSAPSFGQNPIFQYSGTFAQWQNVTTSFPSNSRWGGRDIVVNCQDGAYKWDGSTDSWEVIP